MPDATPAPEPTPEPAPAPAPAPEAPALPVMPTVADLAPKPRRFREGAGGPKVRLLTQVNRFQPGDEVGALELVPELGHLDRLIDLGAIDLVDDAPAPAPEAPAGK